MRSTKPASSQPGRPDADPAAAPAPHHRAPHRPSLRRATATAAAVALALTGVAVAPVSASAAPAPTSSTPFVAASSDAAAVTHTITYDDSSFKIDGQRVNLWSGEFHYFRLPSQDLWRDILEKMKAAGFNAVSLYFDWGYHSPAPGVYDFTGVRDVDKLLDMADELGIYVIARPGPYINAEVDGGGFPTWLSTKPGGTRTRDADYEAYADDWQHTIDAILARHQLTDGGGSIIMYQVENEYYTGTTTGQAYMQHIKQVALDDGITVPLVGNNNGTFNSTANGQLAVDFADSYPQGFNCSNPTTWNGVPDISYDHVTGKPLGTAEFQGGAFDPWGGPGYDKCAQLINDQFASVFYKNNIAKGATLQSFYMTYGGTSWGWLSMPQNYTSYDYGAAIRETRQLDPKYYENKRLGYLIQDVAPLASTKAIGGGTLSSTAIVDTARQNPDTLTQFHTLRHATSTSTTKDTTTLAIDTGAKSTYTYDDADTTHLQYTGTGWSHVGTEQNYTGDDYLKTESFSSAANATLTVPFTGTGISWISSLDSNHGIADVYVDDVKVATVDTYGSPKVSNYVAYRATGLANGAHTLKIVGTGTKRTAATGTFLVVDAIDVLTGPAPQVLTIPQKSGTTITLDGRESKIIPVNLPVGSHTLSYSTSEAMATTTQGGRDIGVLYGTNGTAGETVIPFDSQPTVVTSGGTVEQTWDATSKTLRLNYTHDGLTRVQITGGGSTKPLLLLLADKAATENIWQQQTPTGPVLVLGSHLLRGAAVSGTALALTGDNADGSGLEVFADESTVTWNGVALTGATAPDATHGTTGTIKTAVAVTLPALTGWKHQAESPESAQGFDDSTWTVADKASSNSITSPASLPVLFADDYGFHTGSTWYRGHFTATGRESSITLTTQSGGTAAASSVWLNGTFLGSSTADGAKTYALPAGTLKTGGDNVLSVLTVNMGHEEDYNAASGNKAARGLVGAAFTGTPNESITWRLQGVRGGEDLVDTVRGPLNVGGLYGERAGWYLPGYDTSSWDDVTLPATDTTPGVSWYTTSADLSLPSDQDTSVGLTITDDTSRQYRAQIFVNGWEVGNYVNYRGPQTNFPIPNGILNTHGHNTIAIAVWNLDGSTGGLGQVALTSYGSYTSSLQVTQNQTSDYDAATYAMPAAATASVALTVPNATAAGAQLTVAATVKVPEGAAAANDVTAELALPDGWTASEPTPSSVASIEPGGSARLTWTVTAGPDVSVANVVHATAHLTQSGQEVSVSDARVIGSQPAPPPAGANAVSDLTFVSATNGWGPVERDASVNGSAAGDGHTLTIGTKTYAKGLGTNSVSAVTIFLGGQCTTFTSDVGVDAEAGSSGTVTFSVLVDGHEVASTGTLKGGGAAQQLSASVVGGQMLTLLVGDADGSNANDHGDWGNPILTCTGVEPTIGAVTPVDTLSVPRGTSLNKVLESLPVTTTVTDEYDFPYDVALTWSLDGYDGTKVGSYPATATFTLPPGVQQSSPATPLSLSAQVEVTRTVTPVTLGATTVVVGGKVQVDAAGFDAGEQVAVTLEPAGTALGTLTADQQGDVSGQITLPASTPLGTHRITLTGPTSATVGTSDDLSVVAAPPVIVTSSVTAAAAKAAYGKKATVVATVSAKGVVPTGKVTVRRGTTILGTATLPRGAVVGGNGTVKVAVTIPARALTPGTYSLGLAYGGDGHVQASSGTVRLTVTKATSTVTLKTAKKGKTSKRAKATVTVKASGVTSLTGKVTVYDGKKKLVKATLKASKHGKVTVKLPRLKKGKHKLTVVYAGSSTVAKSTSKVVKVNVKRR